MLRVTLLGNLGGEPEVRFSQKGTQIASFSVAVNQVRTGPDGERQENTEWFRVKVVGRQIEFVQHNPRPFPHGLNQEAFLESKLAI